MPEADLKLAILAAYKRLLRPLVRILIRNSVSFAEFSEIAKDVYVEVAARDFRLPEKNMTQGRIAILTGLTRKEVNRLLDDYYEVRGWDKETGLPTRETLLKLGLDFVVDGLSSSERLKG